MNKSPIFNSEIESKFQAIVSSTQDAIVMMDNRGLITFWNPAAEKMFGYKTNEVLGKELHQIITFVPEHQSKKNNLNAFYKSGKSPVLGKIIELPVKNKKGSTFTIELTVSSAKIDNKWCAIGIMRDVTHKKISEEELNKRIQEVERLNHSMIGRELKMIELKNEISLLKQKIEILEKDKK